MRPPSLYELVLFGVVVIGGLVAHETFVKQGADIATLQHEQAASVQLDSQVQDFIKRQQQFNSNVVQWSTQDAQWQKGLVDFLNGKRGNNEAKGKKAAH
jgi:hypothetical protein